MIYAHFLKTKPLILYHYFKVDISLFFFFQVNCVNRIQFNFSQIYHILKLFLAFKFLNFDKYY